MKKLTQLACLILLCITQPLWAIGLGKVDLHSDLGQTLMMEMTVIGGDNLEDTQMTFGLAPIEDYERLGVEFNRLHSWLKFSIVRDEHKNPILLVTSEMPINEPFLHFIIEMKYPEGRLLKEVSLLLDTPVE